MEASETTGVRTIEQESALEDRPIAELVRRLSEQSTELARMEVELAKAEVAAKGKRLGVGAGEFGAAALLGLLALGALTATLILALSTFLEAWLAALIVTVVYLAIAGVLALSGRKQVERGSPPIPEQAIASAKRDVEAAKRGVQEARS